MGRSEILAQLDKFQGRPPAAAPPLQVSRGPTDGRVLCLRPKTGLPDGEPLSVEVEDEDRRRWLARRVDRNGRQAREASEYPKYAWEKVRDGLCPATVLQRLPRPIEERRIAIAAETKLDQDELLPAPPKRPEELVAPVATRLTNADRVLVWLYQNRAAAARATAFSAPREISAQGIVDGIAIERPLLSNTLNTLEADGLVQRAKRRVLPDGRVTVDTWTLTPRGFQEVDLRVRGGVYPPRLPPVEAVPELVLRRAAYNVRRADLSQRNAVRDLVQAQEDLRTIDRDKLAQGVEQAELSARRSRLALVPVLQQLGAER